MRRAALTRRLRRADPGQGRRRRADATSNATALLADYAHLDSPDDDRADRRPPGHRHRRSGRQGPRPRREHRRADHPVLLVIAFGSLVAALLPLGVGAGRDLRHVRRAGLLTHVTSVSIFAINLTTALGLGLGIDYALLMVSRFREELAAGADVDEAVARTTATAGRTIAFSALDRRRRAVGDAGLPGLLPEVLRLRRRRRHGPLRGQRPARAAGVLAVLGHRVNAGRVPGVKCGTQRRGAVLGSARDGRHAPARLAAAPGDRRAAAAGHSRCWRHVRHAGRPGAADQRRQPPGRRRPAQRLRARRPTRSTSGHPGRCRSRARGLRRTSSAQLPGCSGRQQRRHYRVGSRQPERIRASSSRLDPAIVDGTRQDLRPARLRRRSTPCAPRRSTVLWSAGRRPTLVDAKHAISSRLPLAGGADRGDHVHPALPLHRQRRAADPRPARQRAHARRDARRDGLDLPGRPPVVRPRLHPDADRTPRCRCCCSASRSGSRWTTRSS